jgi:hypothetical protein
VWVQQLVPVQQLAPVQHEPAFAATAGIPPASTRTKTDISNARNLLLISISCQAAPNPTPQRCEI